MVENADQDGRWLRREQRLKSERERMRKHGATLRKVYADAIRKRLRMKRSVKRKKV